MDKLIVINVLDQDTYKDCHIKGSINIPLKDLESYSKKLNKHNPIVVYCASYVCPASTNAYKKLKELGFDNVKAYEGGIAEWKQKNFPTEGPCNLEYLKIQHKPKTNNNHIDKITAEELKTKIKL